MKKLLLPLVLIAALALFGCTKTAPEATATPAPIETPAVTAAPADTPTPADTPVPEATHATGISYTTGLPFEGEYKPLAVMIENSAAARPQRGLQQADVVYEAPVEGGITRFMAIFSDTIPESVMPVRSARHYFIRIQSEWDSAYIHYGGTYSNLANVEHTDEISCYDSKVDGIKYNIDGVAGYNEYFHRMSDRNAPHNVECYLPLIYDLMDYSPTPLPWVFGTADYTAKSDIVDEVFVPFLGNHDYVSYKYDAAKDKFIRSMGGKEFIAEETGAAVEVQNLIIQYVEVSDIPDSQVRMVVVLGEGPADFFIGGRHITGTWERPDYDSPTLYKDDQGNAIVLRPGNTWISIHPNDKEIDVTYAQ